MARHNRWCSRQCLQGKDLTAMKFAGIQDAIRREYSRRHLVIGKKSRRDLVRCLIGGLIIWSAVTMWVVS